LETEKKLYEDKSFVIVNPSEWMGECVRSSSLLKEKRLGLFINLSIRIYKPKRKEKFVKEEMETNNDKKYILFGAVNAIKDKNKGFDILKNILKPYSIKSMNNYLWS
jgi:hypothetical protein